jgi:hypothetical protein
MAEAKVRCTTCYNVFNTAKKEGQNVTCPMCDSSFTVEKTTFVADIRQSLTKVTKGIRNCSLKLKIMMTIRISKSVP